MFLAILDSQFMSLASSELENRLGFFELIVHIIGEKIRGQKIEVSPFTSRIEILNKKS